MLRIARAISAPSAPLASSVSCRSHRGFSLLSTRSFASTSSPRSLTTPRPLATASSVNRHQSVSLARFLSISAPSLVQSTRPTSQSDTLVTFPWRLSSESPLPSPESNFIRSAYLSFIGARRAKKLLKHPVYPVPSAILRDAASSIHTYIYLLDELARGKRQPPDVAADLLRVASPMLVDRCLAAAEHSKKIGIHVEFEYPAEAPGGIALHRNTPWRFVIGPQTADGSPLPGYRAEDWFGHATFMFPDPSPSSLSPSSESSETKSDPVSAHSRDRSLIAAAVEAGSKIQVSLKVTGWPVTMRVKEGNNVMLEDKKTEFVVVMESPVIRPGDEVVAVANFEWKVMSWDGVGGV
ncbi:hypothetical protein M427DRAFT_57628 [Gonapodya prolifera JEL478]|uniref:Uncharacterized protein n=1 Tax=Gonapodya prolifera (strain JEL478) TaxID=1344416 RepID=A0A139ACF3_GONPJ|nr:hypothetical protein M427DRAFT_57628 [Gonapodya prolifera JEL478]|eukprot:KXS14450.1 hypothetical protein M427DRAFT_57628 [Gonapodya prolifera JEL478]